MGSAGGVARRSSRVPEGCCAHSIRRDYFGSAPARAWILGRPTADRVLGLLVAGTSTAQYASYRSYSAPHEPAANRSEEHTSELQSLMRISYAVFCLKKKKTHQHIKI